MSENKQELRIPAIYLGMDLTKDVRVNDSFFVDQIFIGIRYKHQQDQSEMKHFHIAVIRQYYTNYNCTH